MDFAEIADYSGLIIHAVNKVRCCGQAVGQNSSSSGF